MIQRGVPRVAVLVLIALFFILHPQAMQAQNRIYKTYLVPEFFHPKIPNSADTSYMVKCYDKADSALDYWTDFDEVHYVSVFKNYKDSVHLFKDDDGKRKPLPVSLIVNRYDKVSKNKWLHIDYLRHTYTDLLEDKTVILRSDTLSPSQAYNKKDSAINTYSIYRYYKVAPVSK